jgi:hypothetical protein
VVAAAEEHPRRVTRGTARMTTRTASWRRATRDRSRASPCVLYGTASKQMTRAPVAPEAAELACLLPVAAAGHARDREDGRDALRTSSNAGSSRFRSPERTTIAPA